jgi:hypothetical protein
VWSMLHLWMLGAPGLRALRDGGRLESRLRAGAQRSIVGDVRTTPTTTTKLDPRTRTVLLTVAERRKHRPLPSRQPPLVLLSDSQPPETGGGVGPGSGQGFKPALGSLPSIGPEVRIANGLWTSFPYDLDGLDLGVGRRWVWIAPQHLAEVARVDALSG